MSSASQRAAGLLVGLAAGDKNGGPQRLALLLTYSVLIKQKFDINDIWNSYAKWYHKGGFDTGATFVSVYKQLQSNNSLTPKHVSKSLYDNAIKNNELPSVGIGSAHRAAVLSMFPFFITPFQISKDNQDKNEQQDKSVDIEQKEEKKNNENDEANINKFEPMKLEDAAFEESCLTHYAPLSRNCSITVNYLCRALIIGYSWSEALKICHQHIQDDDIKKILMIFIENKGVINNNNYKLMLEMGGYAPEVLKAALYFLNEYKTFDAALTASIKYAGAANYCPVLVGSIGGAIYGIDAVVNSTQFRHKLNSRLIAKDSVSVSIDTTDCKLMKLSDYEIQLAKRVGALWE